MGATPEVPVVQPADDGRGSTKPVLQVEDIHTYYGAIEALKGISLEVFEGEIVTLIGSNGAGKTTTLRSISGIVPPRQGKIIYQGQDITGLPGHTVAGMGIAHSPEGRRIFPRMTVLENLEMGAYGRTKTPRATIDAGLDRVFGLFPRLAERRKQLGGTLSGGEQQMLAIGRALLADPKILLLDEPSMGLAPLLVAQIFEIITEINRQGMTVLLVEQNAAQALRRADRAYVLETGRVVKAAAASELLEDESVRNAYLGGDPSA
jgi:branched-chain amino acid transport system ATP-binding protein